MNSIRELNNIITSQKDIFSDFSLKKVLTNSNTPSFNDILTLETEKYKLMDINFSGEALDKVSSGQFILGNEERVKLLNGLKLAKSEGQSKTAFISGKSVYLADVVKNEIFDIINDAQSGKNVIKNIDSAVII
ncbi:MAG: hypothetical protein JXR48_02020 [Candidatus Delongbacteria bacterium]|nr:hypothetical protein [Candidatus Delongbacteria bacterium]MBN2833722.1 hypothetical protein [Candidatus Delongbacteria bacterium]